MTANSLEPFFSRLKRQMYGTHHAVSRLHLHRNGAECASKHNTRYLTDGERVLTPIRWCGGSALAVSRSLS